MTEFAAWLATLGALRADLPASECVRKLAVEHTFTYPGDVTSATLSGAVKASPDAEAELATFTIGTPSYDAGTGRTSWTFGLSGGTGANSTGSLPASGATDGVATFVYDLLLTLSGGTAQRVAAGLFPVSGFVTEV